MLLFGLGGALLLALVHLFAGKLRFLDVIPRSRWLSFGSGISVAYVFLHLLPELHEAAEPVEQALTPWLGFLDHHVYMLAALGLATFFSLERMVERSRARRRERGGGDVAEPGVFWIHTGSFALYNALIGYVLSEDAGELYRYTLFLVAMSMHFLVNDYGLRHHFKHLYHDRGRWLLSAAVLAGALIGALVPLPRPYLLALLAFLAGGVVLNVLKEELPGERESRITAFLLGLVGYGAILQAV